MICLRLTLKSTKKKLAISTLSFRFLRTIKLESTLISTEYLCYLKGKLGKDIYVFICASNNNFFRVLKEDFVAPVVGVYSYGSLFQLMRQIL